MSTMNNYRYILQHRAETHPERVALIYKEEQINYAQLNIYAIGAANWFTQNGIIKGDRIAFLDFNNKNYVHLINGCLISGVVPVSINWRSTSEDINFILKDAGCKLILYGANFTNLIGPAVSDITIESNTIDAISNIIFKGNNAVKLSLPFVEEEDLALLIYTSGTTGRPKGVRISYNNIFQMYLSLRNETPLFGPASVNLVAGPWYAIVGIGYFVFGIYTGCTNVLLQYFDPMETCALIEKYKITNAFLAPVMMQVICSLDEIEEYDLSSLQNIQYGGSPIHAEQLLLCYKTFNCYFTQGYGLTETSGIATVLRFDDHEKILLNDDPECKKLLRSAGKPYTGVEIKIINEIGENIPFGNIGEVCLKGKVIAQGYWKATGENEKIFQTDGWLMTGDMGYLDEHGYLFLVDRKNDLIISKGINIYPAEIELVLNQHPQIKECAVIGVPHELYGENICVVAVIEHSDLLLSELRTWAKDKLAEYKLPARLEIIQELPRNPTGKILRKELRVLFN